MGIAVQKCLYQIDFAKKEEYKNKALRGQWKADCKEYNLYFEVIKRALQTPLHQSVDFLESKQTDKK